MPTSIPSTASVFSILLRADLTTQWRNRRSSLLSVLIPVIILMSWKVWVAKLGGPFILSNCITIGLAAIGLMGYSNTIARDRDKGIFQRLRVAPAPNWTIMVSRLTVQLVMITILTICVFIVGYNYDHITLSASGYILGFFMSIVGGAVFLGLAQAMVGLITNPETVNATSRFVYIAFFMIGMFGELGVLGEVVGKAVKWSPYGTVKRIVSDSMTPGAWDQHTSIALLLTLGYTLVFAVVGIRKFKWNTR